MDGWFGGLGGLKEGGWFGGLGGLKEGGWFGGLGGLEGWVVWRVGEI